METLLGEVLSTFDVSESEQVRSGYSADLPFALHIALAPQQVDFEAFISWTTRGQVRGSGRPAHHRLAAGNP